MKKLLFGLVILISMNANARKFYFSSSTGNDNYTSTQAQNQATPWASLKKLTQLTTGTNGATVFAAGDTICFKRGDVFANGSANGYCSAYWWNDGGSYFTAPSGTPSAPIVITNYGDPNLPLPNWLYPSTTYPVSTWAKREGRGVIEFSGVHDIIVDGIQSDDYRFPVNDKSNPGYTGGWILGESTSASVYGGSGSNDTTKRTHMVRRFILRNCRFNNVSYGIQTCAMWDSKITNCTFTNFKSSADTAGTHDILAGAIDGINGFNLEISNCYFKGAWGKSGRISSTNGLGGVALDIFQLKNSRIAYNTFIDCSGAYEIGNLDHNDTLSGSQYDTFAFNKVINCGQFGYVHGSVGDPFAGNNHHLYHWNNVVISNNNDRMAGWGFGKDIYGDGQGFAPGTANPWWFCKNPYSTFNPPNYPIKPTVNTVSGSNIITVSSNTGIMVGSVWFTDDDPLASVNYKTVTVTAINGTSITLSDTATRTVTGYTCPLLSGFYLPVANTTWSNPSNSSFSNYGGHRFIIQYAGDATYFGSYIDTMFDCRNNIFYWTTGCQGLYDRNRYKRSSNIYIPKGGALYSSALGGTLNYRGTGEKLYSTVPFRDTTITAFPENWDLHLNDTSYACTNGVSIGTAFTTDFDGNSIVGVTPFIGLYKPAATPVACTSFTYGSWSTCINGTQTRNYTASPSGCTGTPPIDSIQRTCTQSCTFVYSPWTTCSNGTQTRSYTSSPTGCVGTPPIDSVQRTCGNPPCSFTYGSWSACVNNLQTRSYTASPSACLGNPPADSISRTCNPLVLTLVSSGNGTIVVAPSGGKTPYYLSINSTSNYVLNKTTFTGVRRNTYNNIRVKDSNGTVVLLRVYMPRY